MGDVTFMEQRSVSTSSERRRYSIPRVFQIADDLTSNNLNMCLHAVRKRLTALSHMNEGWDGYGAPKISTSTCLFAQQIIQQMWREGVPAPDISPLSSGGFMIEWNTGRSGEFVLEIESPYRMSMIYDAENGETEEVHLGADLSPLSRRIEELAAKAAVAA